MIPHVLKFGREAWEFRRGLLEGIAAMRPGPPFDYSDVLYLVPNSRSVRTLQGMFLDALAAIRGIHGCIPPRITTMNGFISRAATAGTGRPVIDPLTRSMVIDSLAKSGAGGLASGSIGPDTLGGAVSGAIAARLEELESSGVLDGLGDEIPGGGLPGLLYSVGIAYREWLRAHGLSDPYALIATYSPDPGDFSVYSKVVLDGFYDAGPAELRLMLALKEHPDCDFVLEADGLGSEISGMDGSPYAATFDLFERLGMEPAVDDETHAPAVMGTLFGGVTAGDAYRYADEHDPLRGRVRVFEAEDEEAEVRFIAARIKRAYRDGRLERLSDAAVFLPSPDDYLQAVNKVFGDAGIPYEYTGGVPLTSNPTVRDALGLLSLPAEGHRFAEMRAALSSPFFSFSPVRDALGVFSHHARAEGVSAGPEAFRRLAERLDETVPDSAQPELQKQAAGSLLLLLSLTGGIDNRKRPMHDWAGTALEMLRGAGLPESLEPYDETRPGLGRAYQAFSGLIEDIRSASAGLAAPSRYAEFVRLLYGEASAMRLKPEETGTDSVSILNRLQIGTVPYRMIFAAGLVENSMPAAPSPDPFVPERTAERLGLPGARALRDRDARALLSIVLSGTDAVLTRPREFRSRPASPSPFLRGLRPFTGEPAAIATPVPADTVGPSDALYAAGCASSAHGPDVIADTLSSIPDKAPGIGLAVSALRRPSSPVTQLGFGPERFTVTEVEEYLSCGWRYYQRRVLGLGRLEDPEEDFAPHMAGSAVHRIMQRFHETFGSPVTPERRDEALGALRDIADAEFKGLPATLRNMELNKRFTVDVAPRFIRSETERSDSGFRTVAAEMKLSLTLEDGTVITGKIDRLDVSPDGCFEVADYKTGKYPTKPSELFQLPVYAEMVKRDEKLNTGHPGGLRPVSFVYYSLKGGDVRDVVLYAAEEYDKGRRSTDSMERFTEEAMRKLHDAVEAIRKGVFDPDREDRRFCDMYCEFRPSCPRFGHGTDDGDGEE